MRRSVGIALAAGLVSVGATSTHAAPTNGDDYPDQPSDVPFPTEEWATAPLPADVDQHAIDATVEAAFGAPDAQSRVRSLVIVHRGAIVYERYHPLDGPDTVMDSFSVAKSVVSAMIGALVADGRLALDEPAPILEWQDPGDPRAAITLRQLLQMSSGLAWDERYQAGSSVGDMLASPNAADYAVQSAAESAPGTVFEYSSGTTALLAGLAADELGGCEQAIAYLDERILDPIGVTSDDLLLDQSGCWLGFMGANMTSRDFARFGLLYLRGGTWDGEQLLPTTWIDESVAPAPTNDQYGFQWWLYEDVFFAQGFGGQYVAVAPAADLVVVVTATQGADAGGLIDATLYAMSAATPGWTYE